MLINKFDGFEISYKEPITIDNYFRNNIEIRVNGKHKVSLDACYFNLPCAELLTSDNLENVKQGFKLYKANVTYWLEQAELIIL